MPRFGPVKRGDLISCLRRLGFQGPEPGAKRAVMYRGELRVRIPNPIRATLAATYWLEY